MKKKSGRYFLDFGSFWRKTFFLLIAIMWIPGTISSILGQENSGIHIAVLVSRTIRPYLEAVEGINEILIKNDQIEITILELGKIEGKSEELLKKSLSRKEYSLIIGVGPEASRFVTSVSDNIVPMIYTMVLHPERSALPSHCGISLDIPIEVQLKTIASALPSVRRIGLLFDPEYNSSFYREASTYASAMDREIVPLPVSSKSDISNVFRMTWPDIDGLWLIPDQTVISESIVQYVIKQALYNRRPAIGYNRFFYESGATLALVFDYKELGRQTASLALDLLTNGFCESKPPIFHVWQNRRVMDRLEIPPSELPGMEFGP